MGELQWSLGQPANPGSGLSAECPVRGTPEKSYKEQLAAAFLSVEVMFHIHTFQRKWVWKMVSLGFATFLNSMFAR